MPDQIQRPTPEHTSPYGAFGRVRRLHFVGIGGAGMNGIAEVLLNLGYVVTGSDQSENAAVQRLRDKGAEIHIGHDAALVKDADAVVLSTAIGQDNPERVAAQQARIPIVRRAEMLAELMRFRYGIAVAGTHGKTTTTSLVASILVEAALEPTFVIGGLLNSAGTSAKLGAGRYLVAEADESDASFLHLQPVMAIVTNLDADHLETYGGDFNKLRESFDEFLHNLPFYGLAVLCVEDPNLRDMIPRLSRPVRSYGIDHPADVQAEILATDGARTKLQVRSEYYDHSFETELNLPGKHNVLNALAAITVALELDVDPAPIQRALSNFSGIGRRFQVSNDLHIGGGRITLVDDYAHHPAELAATLVAAREAWPERRQVVVFQPHRYTRTRDLFDDFVTVLSKADRLMLTEVYEAGEAPISGADTRSLCRAIRQRGEVEPVLVEELSELPSLLAAGVEDGDVVLMLGAGSIGQWAARLAVIGGA